jgi:hypothetical protein
MKGVLPSLVIWARRDGTIEFFPALASVVSPVQNIIFPRHKLLNFISPQLPQSRQAVVLGRLSLCLWLNSSASLSIALSKPPPPSPSSVHFQNLPCHSSLCLSPLWFFYLRVYSTVQSESSSSLLHLGLWEDMTVLLLHKSFQAPTVRRETFWLSTIISDRTI